MERYDAIIVGSGPAGLEAAINLQIRNKRFLIFGHKTLSQKLAAAPRVDNYLGLPAISGKDLQARFAAHLEQMGIEIQPQQVQMIYPMGDFFSLATSKETYEAKTIILAMGIAHTKPLEGEARLLGRGVGYCATCDAPLYRGKTVAILGYTEEAVHEANYVAELASRVLYFPMKKKKHPTPDAPVEVHHGKVEAIVGNPAVEGIVVDGETIPVDGVFILRDSVAPTSLMPGLAVAEGYIHVDMHMHTNIKGCYAAGDCTGTPHQFMRAAGQGQTAALSAVYHLDRMKKKE